MNPLVAAPEAGAAHTALSVNVNKVAWLRNSRHLGIPSVLRAAATCLRAGAHGITVHPRPDERHIRRQDVFELAALLQDWPQAEFNVEGNPFHNLMDLVRELAAQGRAPQQCTFVPDSEGQFTSDHGWALAGSRLAQADLLAPLVAECRAMGVRVSLFMDADPAGMAAARDVGAQRVELYTEPYAAAAAQAGLAAAAAQAGLAAAAEPMRAGSHEPAPPRPLSDADVAQSPALAQALQRYAAAALAAQRLGLGVNAGHDLNRENLGLFLAAVPGVLEVSIGHALVADALELGLADTVRAYRRCMTAPVVAAHRA